MKIISINQEEKLCATIDCPCGTLFEFEASDMLIKGDYVRTYHISCPTCDTSHHYTESMTEENKEEVNNYINACRSCMECKYMAVIEEGYSSYTVTNISVECKMSKNKHMPLNGYEDRNEKESVYAFAQKCTEFKKGVRYFKEVEQSEREALKKWEMANNSL